MEVKFFEFKAETSQITQKSGVSRIDKTLATSNIYSELPAATIIVKQVVPRASLPLSWLDLTNPGNGTTTSTPRLFLSRSAALEKLFDESHHSPSVLLAKDKTTARYCAIEKVKNGTFALCWLGSWAQEADLDSTIKVPKIKLPSWKREIDQKSEHWWSRAALPLSPAEPLEQHMKRVKLNLSRPPSLASNKIQTIVSPVNPAETESHISNQPQQETIQPIVDEDQLFENLACQYLEALYLSRTSLAFFAKGPLSRIRAAFANTINEHLSIQHLTEFLRTMVLKLSAMDNKFKEKLPELARNLALDFSDDEATKNEKKGRRRPEKKKKLKLNKDGIYPFELEYIQKWWRNDDESYTSPDESGEQKIRRRVGDLRIRETLAQIILILEIMALESSSEWRDADKFRETQDQVVIGENNLTKKRTKKSQNLNILFDLLVDKLAIWQSVEHDTQILSSGADSGKDTTNSWNKDRLGSFCVEVIVPFYKSRIPKHAASIVKSFGGPSQSPDKRRKQAPKHPKESKASKPVPLSKEPESQTKKQTPRSLQKTFSVSNPKTTRPRLARSATDTEALVPRLKREGSEKPSLFSIPLFQEQERKPRRDSHASLKHLQARQINLSSITSTSTTDTKRKRKAAEEEELRDAINAIKKPNRTEAGREVADERDRRAAGTKSKIQPRISLGGKGSTADRKALKTVENVQVLATPHHGRKIDVFSRPVMPTLHTDDHADDLPSSALKSHLSDSIPGTAKKSEPSRMRSSVHETPSKRPPKQRLFGSPELMEKEIPDSAFKTRLTAPDALDAQGIECTPLKPTSHPQLAFDCPSTPMPAKKAKALSIYDSLGWNDYELDE